MADSKAKPAETKKKKKRNGIRKINEEATSRSSKKRRIGFSAKASEPQRVEEVESEKSDQILPNLELEEGFPWKNLQLILFLGNKDFHVNKKVELAFDFVSLKAKEVNDNGEDYETIKMSRVVTFLNDWVQSLLVSSKKRIGFGTKLDIQVIGTYLDFRCWKIFKFCLEESLKLQVSLSFSKNILESIRFIAEDTLSELNNLSSNDIDSYFNREGFELHKSVLDCIGLVFSSHGGLSNESLGLWVSTVSAVVQLVHKVHTERLNNSNFGLYVLELSCLVLEPFAKFLRVNPTHKKNGFHDFVYKLLDPLLYLLGILHHQVDGSFPNWKSKLLTLAEDVLSYGLFHPAQIDGFFSLNSTEKYAVQDGENSRDSKTVIKSYHRHLFAKVDELVAAKKEFASCSIGKLICLLAAQVKNVKGAFFVSEHPKMTMKNESAKHSGAVAVISGHTASEKSFSSTYLTADKRKSLFDVFVLLMEPLLLETNGYLQLEHGVGPVLSDIHCTLRSISCLLASFMPEKIYLRTEDTSDGACISFLKKVYDSIVSLSTILIRSSGSDVCDKKKMEMSAISAKEVLIAVGYLLEIDYDVIGNDLTSLWLMMLSFVALELLLTGEDDRISLSSKIEELGGQLFNLYSQLRQVNNAVLTMCKAIRLLISRDGDSDGKLSHTRFLSPLHVEAHAKSVGVFFCSEGFKLAIQKAVKSTPEGQVSACLQQLIADISESLKWMRVSDFIGNRLDLQTELLGRGLCEVYAMILSSLNVTTGNSYAVGKSVEDLITVLCPFMSRLVGLEPDVVNKFLFSVTENDLQCFGSSTHWVFVFFFQLYMSCRALFRQAMSLMPPDSSKKMSEVMVDSFTALSGQDWMQKTDWKNDGYFSCIVRPSASLDVVIQAVSNIYVLESDVDCSPLIYVMIEMALQRVSDLNRHIKSLEYLLQHNECLLQIRLLDDEDLSRYHKKSRKLKRHISILRQEGAKLTNFVLEYLSEVSKKRRSISTLDYTHESDAWDFSVLSVNKMSLPTAIWWILCQNIDVWSIHAAKKKLKLFLSILIHTTIPFVKSCFEQVGEHNETSQPNRITVWKISLELFNNSILYEQNFVCRYLASRFCRVLEESSLACSFSSSTNVKIMSSPNWAEVLSGLENDCLPASTSEPKAPLLTNVEFTAPQSLLNLFSWIPKGFFDSKSISILLTSILNFERLVIGSLLDCRGTTSCNRVHNLLRLFMSCRKVLKYISMAACDERTSCSETLVSYMYSKKALPVVWLFKSLSMVVGIQSSVSKDSAAQVDDYIFSIMDHTLYVFLTLNKYQFDHAVRSIIDSKTACEEEQNGGLDNAETDLVESDQRSSSSSRTKFCGSVIRVCKSLREQMQSSLILLKDAIRDEDVGINPNVADLNMFSSVIACFSGFLWGFVSVIKQTVVESADHKEAMFSGWKDKASSEINLCVKVFEELCSLLVSILFLTDSQHFQKARNDIGLKRMEDFADRSSGGSLDISMHKEQDGSGASRPCSAATDNNDDSGPVSVLSKEIKSIGSKSVSSFLTGTDSLEDLPLNKSLLRNLLKGDSPKSAFLLRELFMAFSAVLGLKSHINCAPLSTTLIQTLTGISQALLSELVDMTKVPQSFSFVWLDGILKYLEELGNHFPSTNPTLSRNLYVKIVELQLRAIGKCITFEGKAATLASHETESSTKLLRCHTSEPLGMDEFKQRLRMSFTSFIKKPTELHLLSAVQAIERALVGVRERSAMIYDIQTGSEKGGKVSSTVAAGIDCLDLVLESVSGRKRLNVVKRHIQSFIFGAFNIILHLQSPLIFYETLIRDRDADPDPGAVILMCVEVLKRISGKHALYQMEAWHVAQCLRIPGALFQNFHRLRLSNTSCLSEQYCGIDRRFSIDLFAACCRLLHNIVKHHKSELKRCISVLESSVSILLHCLEPLDSNSTDRKGYFSWEVEDGVKCAYCLRRIYEEIRHQKEILGWHCSQFLSDYVWVYSGYGPLKTGIKREIDEALRPGVYALIDASSQADLQHLHTVFGEGPCRNTLATLRHDYKLYFQYEGKV